MTDDLETRARRRRGKALLVAGLALAATGTNGCDWQMVAQVIPVIGTVLQSVGQLMTTLPGQVQGQLGGGGAGGLPPTSGGVPPILGNGGGLPPITFGNPAAPGGSTLASAPASGTPTSTPSSNPSGQTVPVAPQPPADKQGDGFQPVPQSRRAATALPGNPIAMGGSGGSFQETPLPTTDSPFGDPTRAQTA